MTLKAEYWTLTMLLLPHKMEVRSAYVSVLLLRAPAVVEC